MSSNGGASTYEAADKIPPWRQYFREKQREYRRKRIADGATAGRHPWRRVKQALVRCPGIPLPQRSKDKPIVPYEGALQRFVVMNIPPHISLSDAWQNATLAVDPSARNLGKEWLTQQMNHNMHEAFVLLPTVRLDEDFVHVDMQMTDDGTVQMFRRVVESNMRVVIYYYNPIEMAKMTSNTRLFHTTTSEGIFVNTLQGHFAEANRFVAMVMCQVEHDQAYVCQPTPSTSSCTTDRGSASYRQLTSWYVLSTI
ncbi:hypothetical protein H257_08293 [Aphanomyces astaci]|uniref:Uncharacterized protein n=1 Tax=Aphanomyces astaci TaxID=112090 RepID=W4GEK6_APHAT|nr:hypothetical protein H257_08293 [Aphanomyces astaci]ETV78085.1 hypothetical protein H257_08293 [Aphanomyces astaci]|eukprot:XP_009832422.1 hypothetical protein H257_08293 [Aphanomyces astaci]